jgi:3-isopropylmalate dehydrogenase
MADKSNAMTHGHALWQRVFKALSPRYPSIDANASVHRCAGDVSCPESGTISGDRHQQLFGDIITDIGAALQGGLGMAASG